MEPPARAAPSAQASVPGAGGGRIVFAGGRLGAAPPEIFLSTSQLDYGWPDEMFVSVRTAGDPGIVLPFLRRGLAEAAPRAVLKDARNGTVRDEERLP